MKLSNLSNEEIIFIHLMIEDRLETLNEVLDKGGITYIMDSPLGKVELFGKFTEKELQDTRESIKYKIANSIVEKLDPVYELIADGNNDIIDRVRRSLFPQIDDEDEN